MGGFIIIDDGRAVAPNNWGYDRMVEEIANSLPPTLEGSALEEWLLDQRIAVRGVGEVDVRELTEDNQQLFWAAVADAIELCEREGPSSKDDPGWDAVFFASWLEMFRNLLKLRDPLRGEPPVLQSVHEGDHSTDWQHIGAWMAMKSRIFNTLSLISAILLACTIILWAWSFRADPRKDRLSFSGSFHVGFYDGRIDLFSHKHGPYHGSVIALLPRVAH